MEESLNMFKRLTEEFDCREVDIRTYSPLALAYIGDSIYDVVIRTVVVERGNQSAKKLHRTAVRYVNAGTQARMAEALQEIMTEEEKEVYRRGRNAKSNSTAKNASVTDYRKATGMEALIGYLYLQDRMDRAVELVKQGLAYLGLEI